MELEVSLRHTARCYLKTFNYIKLKGIHGAGEVAVRSVNAWLINTRMNLIPESRKEREGGGGRDGVYMTAVFVCLCVVVCVLGGCTLCVSLHLYACVSACV